MATTTKERTSYLQHKVRREVKEWIEKEARAQERSQTWVINRIVEDAYARAQHDVLGKLQ